VPEPVPGATSRSRSRCHHVAALAATKDAKRTKGTKSLVTGLFNPAPRRGGCWSVTSTVASSITLRARCLIAPLAGRGGMRCERRGRRQRVHNGGTEKRRRSRAEVDPDGRDKPRAPRHPGAGDACVVRPAVGGRSVTPLCGPQLSMRLLGGRRGRLCAKPVLRALGVLSCLHLLALRRDQRCRILTGQGSDSGAMTATSFLLPPESGIHEQLHEIRKPRALL
jgi:hypothetical protein